MRWTCDGFHTRVFNHESETKGSIISPYCPMVTPSTDEPPWKGTLHCTLYTLDSKLYIVHCTLKTLHYTLCIVHSTLYPLHCTLYTLHCTLYNIHFTLYTVLYILYTVHCTIYTLHCTLLMNSYEKAEAMFSIPESNSSNRACSTAQPCTVRVCHFCGDLATGGFSWTGLIAPNFPGLKM